MWQQKEITLIQFPRGFHIITDEIIKQIPNINNISTGLLHIFIKHTSASLTINSAVDFEFRKCCPNNFRFIIS